MNELLVWCAAHLQRYDVRVAFLPASGLVRVWIQVDRDGKRRVPLCNAQGEKLVGEAALCGPAVGVLEEAACALLRNLQTTTSDTATVIHQAKFLC